VYDFLTALTRGRPSRTLTSIIKPPKDPFTATRYPQSGA
jgi:hypothetical protein